MANSPQARKRIRQSRKRRLLNMSQRSNLRTTIKRFLQNIKDSNKEGAQESYRIAVSTIDKAVTKGLHHKNRAARLKSRLNARLKAMS